MSQNFIMTHTISSENNSIPVSNVFVIRSHACITFIVHRLIVVSLVLPAYLFSISKGTVLSCPDCKHTPDEVHAPAVETTGEEGIVAGVDGVTSWVTLAALGFLTVGATVYTFTILCWDDGREV